LYDETARISPRTGWRRARLAQRDGGDRLAGAGRRRGSGDARQRARDLRFGSGAVDHRLRRAGIDVEAEAPLGDERRPTTVAADRPSDF
jgi:hypothetical protein